MPTFVVATCQPGAERALKAEAALDGFASSFQRPGFVTFKAAADVAVDAVPAHWVFARFTALSLGKIEGDVTARLRAVEADRLHVLTTTDDQSAATALRDDVMAQIPERFRPGIAPKLGETVATLVLVDGAPWLSLHRHARGRAPFPGGRFDEPLPPEAPSRAWLKLEEASRVFQLPLLEGQRALELGSAPGGASFGLLQRGLFVTGVDPNDMDPRVLAHPHFTYRRTTSMSLDPRSLAPLDWVLLDVNVPPGTALRSALPFLEAHAQTLQGIAFTLKMKDWSIAGEVEGWLKRIRRSAPLVVVGRQLSTNGQEICVVGRREA